MREGWWSGISYCRPRPKEIADALKAIKADDESLKLQEELYEKAQHPIDTKQ